jgi:hypothetical protein
LNTFFNIKTIPNITQRLHGTCSEMKSKLNCYGVNFIPKQSAIFINVKKTYNVNTSPSKLNNGCTFVNWGREFDIKYLFMPSVNFEETQWLVDLGGTYICRRMCWHYTFFFPLYRKWHAWKGDIGLDFMYPCLYSVNTMDMTNKQFQSDILIDKAKLCQYFQVI